MRPINTIFLSGTDLVRDLFHDLAKQIRGLGLTPWFFHDPAFPYPEIPDAFTRCLTAAKSCDLLIAAIDARAGAGRDGKTFTETEINAALEHNIPLLVFVRAKHYYQSSFFHRLGAGTLSPEELRSLGFSADKEVYAILERLHHRQVANDWQVPWINPFTTVDDIFQHIVARASAQDSRHVTPHSSLDKEPALLLNDPTWESDNGDFNITELIYQLTTPLSPEVYRVTRERLLAGCWGTIRFDPVKANQLSNSIAALPNNLNVPLLIVCSFSTGLPILASDLYSAATTLLEIDTHESRRLLTRILRAVAYERTALLETSPWEAILTLLSAKADYYWTKWLTDLYLRHTCGYLELPTNSKELCLHCQQRFQLENPQEAVSALILPLTRTLEFARLHNPADIFPFLTRIASTAKDSIDAKWVLLCFLRIQFLIDEDSQTESHRSLSLLIETIPTDILEHAINVQVLYMLATLRTFAELPTRDVLDAFVKRFLKYRRSLALPEVYLLQTEYVSALHEAIDQGISGVDNHIVDIYSLLAGNRILQHPLYANPICSNIFALEQIVSKTERTKESLLKLLKSYLKTMWRFYIKPLTLENVLVMRPFQLLGNVRDLNPLIGKDISIALATCLAKNRTPSYCGAALSLFRLCGRGRNIDLLFQCLTSTKGLLDIELSRRAHSIFRSVYVCFYYGDRHYRDNVMTLGRTYSDTLIDICSRTKPFWIYWGGVLMSEKEAECEFAHALYSDEGLQGNSLEFRDMAVGILNRYAAAGSTIATVFTRNLNDPLLWNVVGTTLFNLYNQRQDIIYLRTAAFFYSWALAFSKSWPLDTLKYRYNYIRARSLAMIADGVVDEDFVESTLLFISQKGSGDFTFKSHCVGDLVHFLSEHRHKLSRKLSELFKTTQIHVRWFGSLCAARSPSELLNRLNIPDVAQQ